MKLMTWNVNSVRARLDNIIECLNAQRPDIVAFQEIKCIDDAFPAEVFEDMGYNLAIFGQKSYNGVALLSKYPLNDIVKNMPDFPDEHVRLIQGEISLSDKSCLIINGYMPNGNPVSSDKFPYKLAWLRALVDYVRTLRDMNVPFILCGDFNIIPTDFDVHNPDEWRDDALFRKESVALYRELLYMGLTDTVRFFNPHTPCYSFWDYQARAREKNHGIRIDHILPSPDMMDYAVSASVLDMYRDAPKASDHAPVILELQF